MKMKEIMNQNIEEAKADYKTRYNSDEYISKIVRECTQAAQNGAFGIRVPLERCGDDYHCASKSINRKTRRHLKKEYGIKSSILGSFSIAFFDTRQYDFRLGDRLLYW